MKEFIWQKKYPAGVAKEIGPIEYHSLPELFQSSCKTFHDSIAFENMSAQLTYAQVDRLSTNFAAYLQQKLGLKKNLW